MLTSHIRNFCIISHVDHGKSTLADRFLELTNTIPKEKMKPQYLDRMPLERERGITIKLQPATMTWKDYTLNLIDTPGHVDFSYEVSRSLAAVEGAILLVDVSQGIQAQTLANLYLAQEQKLALIPVINKIDLESIDIDERKKELANISNKREDEIICISAKKGINIEKVLRAVVETIPPPQDNKKSPLRALIFDSYFDEYKGVIAYVRIFDGNIRSEENITFLASGASSEVQEVGIFSPDLKKKDVLGTGEIGYIITGLKDIEKCRVGDTIAHNNQSIKPLAGYVTPQPMVFAGLYPKAGTDKENLRQALARLKLNDASLIYEAMHSPALGFGFRAGFLGLLHMDIVRERLKREYDLDVIISTPSVAYHVFKKGDDEYEVVHSPLELPDPSTISHIEEPWMKIDIITPKAYIGSIMELLSNIGGEKVARTTFVSLEYIGSGSFSLSSRATQHSTKLSAGESRNAYQRAMLHYHMPLSKLLTNFYDTLKSVSQGFASYSYQFLDYRHADVAKLDILVAGEPVDQLSSMVYKDEAYKEGRKIVSKLKQILPRQLFEVKIQAAMGGRILASERIPPLRKDVTAKLYGGDVTRKKKLLAKQKKGKKKLVKLGKVNIPPEAYWAVMKR
ncbi:translation elongation factor 4 [Patescibacteria group bacterium AH-259-L07]|nr:translation elongation factor 4 [Patescibacteria group bacterium AH-259-L07]